MIPMLAGKNIAILVANGFDENQMTEIQRALTKAKANIQTVAPEQGVVNGWQGDAWGHYFPVNAQIGEALGSDFDILVLPGGERSVTKLKTNLHTRRIIGHFLDANKPVVTIGAGAGLLALSDKIAGRVLAAAESVQAELKTAGAEISEDAQHIEGNIFSANGIVNDWVDAALDFLSEAEAVMQAA